MLSEALAFPRRGDDWLKTVIIGGVLSLLGFLILPTILVNGYLVRVMGAAVEGKAEPPVFEDWADLFVDGLLLWVIQLVYTGIPAFLFAVGFTFVAAAGAAAGSATDEPGVLLGVGLVAAVPLLLLGALLLVASYLLPAALANFARTGDFGAAFHLRTVARAAVSGDYFIAVLLVIVVSIVLGLIGGLLLFVLVGIFVLFYLQVVAYHLFAQGFAGGLGLEPSAG